jgi:hypothetical protein
LAFDEPPTADAPYREIAQHIDAEVVPDLWWYLERAPTRMELRAWCEGNGYGQRWPKVGPELRRLRALTAPRSTRVEAEDGVFVDTEMLDEIGDLHSLCPFILRGVWLTNFRLARSERPCGSWWCATCGPKNARALKRLLADRIGSLETVYVASAQWSAKLMPRMRQRRSADQQWLSYHRLDDMAFFISNSPIRGNSDPKACQALTPTDALEFFAREVAWVPGHLGHAWTPGWKPSPVTRDRESSEDWMPLDGLSDPQVDELMARFRMEAARRFGVRTKTGSIPQSVHDDLVQLLRDLVQDLRREIDERYAAGVLDEFDDFVNGVKPEDFGTPGPGEGA